MGHLRELRLLLTCLIAMHSILVTRSLNLHYWVGYQAPTR